MNRLIWAFIWLTFGVVLLTAAWLVAAHFRSVDVMIVERAGTGTPSVVQAGINMAKVDKVGPARVLAQAAEALGLPDRQDLITTIAQADRLRPSSSPFSGLDSGAETASTAETPSMVQLLMRRSVREGLLRYLSSSRRLGVHEILSGRSWTNTVLFEPVPSPSGQPLEAAITLTGLLVQGDYFSQSLRVELESLVARTNADDRTESLETVYMDLLSLGWRTDWEQLTELVRPVRDLATLHDLAQAARDLEESFPILYSASVISGQPESVTRYLAKFPKTGAEDIGKGLRRGQGALHELLRWQRRISAPEGRLFTIGYDPFGALFYAMLPVCRMTPVAALGLKCLLFLAGAFCVGRAIETAAAWTEGSTSFQLVGVQWIQTSIFTIMVAGLAILFTEPFLMSETQQAKFPIRLQLPIAGSAAVSKLQTTIQPIMETLTIAALVTFFTLQSLIYIWCLSKLGEIRRQLLSPGIKLRLLENEEHLFDAGLYLGFVGTVISLILVTVGIVEFSLMAAYSSTSFGIIFVSILKIFHLRPYRRQLIMQTEQSS